MQRFSSGYYLIDLTITPYSGERAVISNEWFGSFRRSYTDTRPLVFKVDSLHIPAYGEAAIPDALLALPDNVCEQLDLFEAEDRSVLLAKQDTVDEIIIASGLLFDGSEEAPK